MLAEDGMSVLAPESFQENWIQNFEERFQSGSVDWEEERDDSDSADNSDSAEKPVAVNPIRHPDDPQSVEAAK